MYSDLSSLVELSVDNVHAGSVLPYHALENDASSAWWGHEFEMDISAGTKFKSIMLDSMRVSKLRGIRQLQRLQHLHLTACTSLSSLEGLECAKALTNLTIGDCWLC